MKRKNERKKDVNECINIEICNLICVGMKVCCFLFSLKYKGSECILKCKKKKRERQIVNLNGEKNIFLSCTISNTKQKT
jgi:hypothetical protein